MRQRRFIAALLFLGVFLCLLVIIYLSICTEVSYYVKLNKFNGDGMFRFVSLSSDSNNCKKLEQIEIEDCQILDVAIVSGGYESAGRTATLVKSLLFHRRHPLHLHLIVDNISYAILGRLFDTWQLSAVQISMYDSQSIMGKVSWIKNTHYSGVYGLLKLALPDILPKNLSHVLIVDTDVLFVSDVSKIWTHWHQMNDTQALGLVENLSDWYLDKMGGRRIPWPALERGFNTGVILMDLKKLDAMNWQNLWSELTTNLLQRLGATQLADQDIFNAVIASKPEIVYRLPCRWNLQMGFRSLQDLCPAKIADLRIVHWNSPEKTRTHNRYSEFFRRHYQTFLEMDGSLLRREMLRCPSSDNALVSNIDYEEEDADGCAELRAARKIVYRTHLFIRSYHMDFNRAADVTLITQMSMERLQMFEQLVEKWDGPISVALYLSDSETNQLLRFAAESPILSRRHDIGFHVVYKEGSHYPINYLRNVALNASSTPFVFLIDVDFLPMFGLYDALRQAVVARGSMDRKALIIPAFESHAYRNRQTFPKSKAELLNQWNAGRIQAFRQDIWLQGHAATNYDKWRSATAPYLVGWETNFEPYIAVNRNVSRFDRRFMGFGWNKVSHIMMLNMQGYDFIVLPNTFIIHQPHAPSYEITRYRSSGVYRRCLKALKGEFARDLAKYLQNQTNRYGVAPIAETDD